MPQKAPTYCNYLLMFCNFFYEIAKLFFNICFVEPKIMAFRAMLKKMFRKHKKPSLHHSNQKNGPTVR